MRGCVSGIYKSEFPELPLYQGFGIVLPCLSRRREADLDNGIYRESLAIGWLGSMSSMHINGFGKA